MQILLYGVPGSGKTTSGILLSRELQMPLISGDYLRDTAMSEHTDIESPFAYVGTCQAWAKFGSLTTEHAIKGLLAARDTMQPYVASTITATPECIFEAAFLNPHTYLKTSRLCLIIAPNEQQHRKQFFQERTVTDDTSSEFAAARLVQKYLVHEAESKNIPIIANEGAGEHLVFELLQIVSPV